MQTAPSGSLMKVKSIAECSKGSILQYFRPPLSYQLLSRSFCLFLSGSFTQVLLYMMKSKQVSSQVSLIRKTSPANAANKWLFSRVNSHVSLQLGRTHTDFTTKFAIMISFKPAIVKTHVALYTSSWRVMSNISFKPAIIKTQVTLYTSSWRVMSNI